MSKPAVTLLAKRDFGQKINATFEFLTQNFKPLAKALLTIAGPPALLTGIIKGVTSINALKTISGDEFAEFLKIFQAENPLASLLTLITGIFATCTVYSFITLYEEEGSSVSITPAKIWERLSSSISTVLGSTFIYFIIVILGAICLIIPGIYLGVALAFYQFIIIRERAGATDSLRRSNQLIRGKWWSTFGLMFVMGIIMGILSLCLQIPVAIIGIFKAVTINSMTDANGILLILGNILSALGSIFFQALVATALAFQYYNLVERTQGEGIRADIDSIGSDLSTDSNGGAGI
jgi:hypothetical protein